MPAATFPDLAGDVPIALLPMRIETSFQPRGPNPTELWVRIFPDTIHSFTFEDSLTSDEAKWGQRFWQQTWRAGKATSGPEAETRRRVELAAWHELASRYGPTRSLYVAKKLFPTNDAERPAEPNPDQDAPLAREPLFADPGLARPASWSRAAIAGCLPDRWLIVAKHGQETVSEWTTRPVSPVLAIGPGPQRPGDTSPTDPDLAWLQDFAAAESAGMAVRLTVTADQAKSGFDRLIVVGVKGDGVDKYEGSQALSRLLDSHRYTWGLSFVPQATPTSNTRSTASDHSISDPGFERAFRALQLEVGGEALNAEMDGALLAKALGLDPGQFAAVDGSRNSEHSASSHINRALWPITFGYFAEQMFDGVFGDFNAQAWADYFSHHVWARGPLPAVRVGRQPFGVLPVTTIDGWKATPAAPPQLSAFLTGLRDNLSGGKLPPHGGRDPSQVGQDLVDVLAQDAVATSCSVRRARGPEFMRMFWRLPTKEVPDDLIAAAFTNLKNSVDAEARSAGLTAAEDERLSQVSYANVAETYNEPIIQEDDLSETQPLGDNYIARLIDPTIPLLAIHDEAPSFWPGSKPKPLLYRLLRHATLLAYARQALDTFPDEIWDKDPHSAPFFEPELVDMWPYSWGNNPDAVHEKVTPERTPTFWRILSDTLPSGSVLGVRLRAMGMNPPEPLRSFLSSLSQLAGLPSAALARLFSEAIGLASHRLDAWGTSVAAYLLSQCRLRDTRALYVGGFGWVENVPPAKVPPANASRSDGFVHAPSLSQASTAAVLMSARLANNDQRAGARMEMDLSSSRVRLALELIDGVRQGQAIGAMLGYRIERGLHDAGLHSTVYDLRRLAPIAGGEVIPRDATEPAESVAANNVVDGRKLLGQCAEDPTIFDALGLSQTDKDALVKVIKSAQDVLKAVGDLCLAEAVHQATQGNYSRAAASLNAASRGDSMPPDFDVIRTPVSGIAMTQRVLLLFPGTPASPAANGGWSDSRARALANPALNAWAAQIFGPASDIKFQARYYSADQNPDEPDPEKRPKPLKTESIALEALQLCPLDLVFAPALAESPQQSELELRMMRQAMEVKPMGAEFATQVRLTWLSSNGQDIRLGLLELFELARALRDVLTAGRVADARDLARAGQDIAAGFVANALDPNLVQVKEAWTTAKSELEQVRSDSTVTGDEPTAHALEVLRDKMEACGAFAVQHTAPMAFVIDQQLEPRRSQRGVLVEQADGILRQMDAIEAIANDSSRSAADRLKAYVGENFPLAAVFRADASSKWSEGLAYRSAADDTGRDVLDTWIRSLSNVRPAIFKLNLLELYTRMVKGRVSTGLAYCAAQLPFGADDAWNKPVGPADTGATCIVAATGGPADAISTASSLWGMVIDEWIETVPRSKLMSGIAFQYDQADTPRSPQSMLIACAPDPDQRWSEESLVNAVAETLEWAKLRMIDYDRLGNFGHLLPMIFMAENIGGVPGGDTVSTQLH